MSAADFFSFPNQETIANSIKVIDVTACVQFLTKINVPVAARFFPDFIEKWKKRKPLYLTLSNPAAFGCLYPTGKMLISGCKTVFETWVQVDRFTNKLRSMGLAATPISFEIKWISAEIDLKQLLSLAEMPSIAHMAHYVKYKLRSARVHVVANLAMSVKLETKSAEFLFFKSGRMKIKSDSWTDIVEESSKILQLLRHTFWFERVTSVL